MEVVIALILVLAAGWFLMSLFFVRQKTTQQESDKAKHQKTTPYRHKRVPSLLADACLVLRGEGATIAPIGGTLAAVALPQCSPLLRPLLKPSALPSWG